MNSNERFKVGERAKCIEPENWVTGHFHSGEVFTVSEKDLQYMNDFTYTNHFLKIEFALGDKLLQKTFMNSKHTRTITKINEGGTVELKCSCGARDTNCDLANYVRVGDVMSRYDEMKQKIDAITEHTSLLEVNKIAVEICASIPSMYKGDYAPIHIQICGLNSGGMSIVNVNKKAFAHTDYNDECGKLAAFKDALLSWLDISDIKRKADERQKEKVAIEKEIESLQEKLRML